MLIVKPLEAILPENFKSANRTEPYCLVTLGDCQIKGRPCKKGGTTPTWRDNLVFHYKQEFLCCVQVKDRYLLTNDGLIGTCAIDLEYLREEKRSSRWFNLYYRKEVVGQILIELVYPAASQDLRFINPKAQDITKQSKEQIRLLERNMNKHMWNDDDIMVISDDDINPISMNAQTVPLQERNPNIQREHHEIKPLEQGVTPKFCDSTTSEICPRESMKSVQISHLGTTPSKSQQIAKESKEKEKRPRERERERSLGRKIIDSVKNFFTSRRKQSVQVEPVPKESLQKTDTKEINISPIKMAKQESDQSGISMIKSIVFDQKNDQQMQNIKTEPNFLLSEVLNKEEKSIHKKKANFSVNSLVFEEKENNSRIANRMTTTESASLQTRDSVMRMKSQSNSARNNLHDTEKENIEKKKNNDEVDWLEMTQRGVITIEDLSNNEKRILEIKPTRMSLERESTQSTISSKTGVNRRKINAGESLNRYRSLYR